MTYSEKLKDPRWQKKRLEILNRDNWMCQACYSTTNTLHVHHLDYEQGIEPWEYPEYYLQTLCEECHSEYENKKKEIESAFLKKYRLSINTPFIRGCFSSIISDIEMPDIIYLIWELGAAKVLELLMKEHQENTLHTVQQTLPENCPACGNSGFRDIKDFLLIQCTLCGYVHKYGANKISKT